MIRKRLGRGIDSLFSPADLPAEVASSDLDIQIDTIEPNPYQPRRVFDPGELEQLRRSIQDKGVLQPVMVRPTSGGYQLILGERRLRACRELGMTTIPAIVRELPDSQMLEVALVENIQRKDLNPIEKAEAFRQLIDSLQLTHDEAADRVGKDRSSVTNYLRLLELPKSVCDLVAGGQLTMGHARAILSLPTTEEQENAAREVVEGRLSVRATERQFSGSRTGKKKGRGKRLEKPNDHRLQDLERQFEEALSTKVRIVKKGRGGQVVLDFYSDAEFLRLQEVLLGRTVI